MTQRNPMNDRYQTDEKKGQTRKSAASVKPKTKAAASVHVQSATKTPQQKKAVKKTARQQQAQVDRKYYNPPTAEYKRLRKLWWVMLVGAIVMTAFSWFSRSWFPGNDMIGYVTLGLAYILIIGALFIDFSKIRKVRRAYQDEMEASKTKEQRAEEKKAKAAALEAKAQAAAAPQEEAPKKRGLFGSGFKLPAKKVEAEDVVLAGVNRASFKLPAKKVEAEVAGSSEKAKTEKSPEATDGAQGILGRAKKTATQAEAEVAAKETTEQK